MCVVQFNMRRSMLLFTFSATPRECSVQSCVSETVEPSVVSIVGVP